MPVYIRVNNPSTHCCESACSPSLVTFLGLRELPGASVVTQQPSPLHLLHTQYRAAGGAISTRGCPTLYPAFVTPREALGRSRRPPKAVSWYRAGRRSGWRAVTDAPSLVSFRCRTCLVSHQVQGSSLRELKTRLALTTWPPPRSMVRSATGRSMKWTPASPARCVWRCCWIP